MRTRKERIGRPGSENAARSLRLVLLLPGGGMVSTSQGVFGLAVHPALKGNEAFLLEALLGCTDYGVLITSETTRQDILCNARFGEIFGLDPNEAVLWTPDLVQEHVLPRIREPERFLGDLRHVYTDSMLERVDELELVGPDQVLRRHTCPLHGVDGRLLGRVWTFLDITPVKTLQRQVERHARHLEALVEERTRALREMQNQLVESEKLAAVGLLAATIAHDLRNILTPMKLELNALPVDDPEAAETLDRQMQRLAGLTHRLLSLSQPPRLAVSVVDLRRAWTNVEPLVRAQAEQDGCRLEIRFHPEPVEVEVNTDQIEQIFVNLAMNALTAMAPDGGSLTVQVGIDKKEALARFIDTGPGIPARLSKTLFRPFVTGRAGGTGLGLYSCRRIAQDHGGNVVVERGEGRGAVLSVRLPLANPPSI